MDGMTLSLPHDVTSSGRQRGVGGGNDGQRRRRAAQGELRRARGGRTFGRAQLAGVRPAVVLVHRVEQQPTLAAVKVHLAVEQRRLDQLPVGQPVHVGVLGPDDVALEQDGLPGVGRDVPDWADDGQAGLHRRRWEEVASGDEQVDKKKENHQPGVGFFRIVTFDLQLPFALLGPVLVDNLAGVNAGV